jgi:hypothetical protein
MNYFYGTPIKMFMNLIKKEATLEKERILNHQCCSGFYALAGAEDGSGRFLLPWLSDEKTK